MKRFPAKTITAVRGAQVVGLRAGRRPHRTIAVWAVVIRDRVFIRSWRVSSDGWFYAFKHDPTGVLTLGNRAIRVSAIHTRSEALKHLVSEAYAEKYSTPGSRRYVRDLARKRCRDATIELIPRRKASA